MSWKLPEHIPAESNAVRCAIALLKLVESAEIDFKARRMSQRSRMFSSLVPTTQPSSEYLTSKLHQQLQDCVTLCSQVALHHMSTPIYTMHLTGVA